MLALASGATPAFDTCTITDIHVAGFNSGAGAIGYIVCGGATEYFACDMCDDLLRPKSAPDILSNNGRFALCLGKV